MDLVLNMFLPYRRCCECDAEVPLVIACQPFNVMQDLLETFQS